MIGSEEQAQSCSSDPIMASTVTRTTKCMSRDPLRLLFIRHFDHIAVSEPKILGPWNETGRVVVAGQEHFCDVENMPSKFAGLNILACYGYAGQVRRSAKQSAEPIVAPKENR